jgi:hypothetical protein
MFKEFNHFLMLKKKSIKFLIEKLKLLIIAKIIKLILLKRLKKSYNNFFKLDKED